MGIGSPDQFGYIDSRSLVLVEFQVGTHKISMRVSFNDGHNLSRMCGPKVPVELWISPWIDQGNFSLTQNGIASMG
jgi:hypothetical protein